nr:hypothetical protein [uncultured bacterium]
MLRLAPLFNFIGMTTGAISWLRHYNSARQCQDKEYQQAPDRVDHIVQSHVVYAEFLPDA